MTTDGKIERENIIIEESVTSIIIPIVFTNLSKGEKLILKMVMLKFVNMLKVEKLICDFPAFFINEF